MGPGSNTTVRPAAADDLPHILPLTVQNRALQARLDPAFWRPSANADALHAQFLEYLVKNQDITARVLEKDGRVIGFAVSVQQPGLWFIDDVCLAEEGDWATDGAQLLGAIDERPAAMTAPHGDTDRIRAAIACGLELASTFRLIRLDEPSPKLDLTEVRIEPLEALPQHLVDPPLHVFGGAMTAERVVVIGDENGGYAVVSPSVQAPPIYDPGGTTAVLDRVISEDRRRTLHRALRYAAQRGDVGVILVVDGRDEELADLADELDASHPVDVLKWP